MCRLISLMALLSLYGCTAIPELYKTVDDIATDDAITIKVDRDAFQRDTDVSVSVEVRNKDIKEAK